MVKLRLRRLLSSLKLNFVNGFSVFPFFRAGSWKPSSNPITMWFLWIAAFHMSYGTLLAWLDWISIRLLYNTRTRSPIEDKQGQTIRTMPAQCGSCEDFLSKGISLSIRSNNASHLSLLSQQINTFFRRSSLYRCCWKNSFFPFCVLLLEQTFYESN